MTLSDTSESNRGKIKNMDGKGFLSFWKVMNYREREIRWDKAKGGCAAFGHI